MFRRVQGERDYALVSGSEAGGALLGSRDIDSRLTTAKNGVTPFVCAACSMRCGEDDADARGIHVHRERPRPGDDRNLGCAPVGRWSDDRFRSLRSVDEPLRQGQLSLTPSVGRTTPRPFSGARRQTFGWEEGRRHQRRSSPRTQERELEDGEQKIRSLVNVRDRDVFVIYGLHGEHDRTGADKLCRLLFFIGALRDADAARVTAIVPYLCYARKDRQTKPRDPVTTRYVAQLFEAIGADRVVVIDVHNIAAFQNAFRRRAIHLHAQAVFAQHIAKEIGQEPLAVVSPDLGGEKRAELFRERLERLLGRPVAKGFMDKHRSMGKVTGEIFAGDIESRTAIVLDDLISTGGTMARTAAACRKHGAKKVWLAATHGVFSKDAGAILRDAPFDRLIITDTVPLPSHMNIADLKGRLAIVSVAGLVAEAIHRLHDGGSINELLDKGP